MQTKHYTFGSKAVKMFIATIVVAGLGLASCKKTSDSSTDAVSEQDAVQLTTDAVIPQTAGLALQATTTVTLYKSVTLTCGVKKDSTITKSSPQDVIPNYSYTLNWDYELDCISGAVTFNHTGSSKYNGILMSSDDSSTGSFVLSGLSPASSNYIINNNYVRNGSQTSKIGRQHSFTSKITLSSSNLAIDKTTNIIQSGTATVTISGQTTGGKSFSFAGKVTFLGNDKATIVLNSGTSYPVSW